MTEEDAVKKSTSGGSRVAKYADNVLPMARVKKIMKMDPNITDNITVEANYLVCAAAELFIKSLSKDVYEMDKRCLSYQNLSKYVQEEEKLDFLHDVVPTKITLRECKKMIAEDEQKSADLESGSDVTESEFSSGGEEEEEEGEDDKA